MQRDRATPPAYEVCIVGGGPAGLSTALHLLALAPELRDRIVVLEKSQYPREKVCGGAISGSGAAVLRRLGLPFEFRHTPIRTIEVRYGRACYELRGEPILRIVHRAEFDAWLAGRARERGVRIIEGADVRDLDAGGAREGEGAQARMLHGLATRDETYKTRIIVAADGSRSRVRQLLGIRDSARTARLIEAWAPAPEPDLLLKDGRVRLYFDPMDQGVQGYAWDFPASCNGEARRNQGVFDSRAVSHRPGGGNLKPILAAEQARWARTESEAEAKSEATTNANAKAAAASDAGRIQGAPLLWFSARSELSRPGVLLVGDAAGADPLFGEGISYALEYGHVAACEIVSALARKDASFSGYRRRILRNPLLAELNRRARLARAAYGVQSPLLRRIGWQCAKLFAPAISWTEPPARLGAPR